MTDTTTATTDALITALWRDGSRRAWALLQGAQMPGLPQRLADAQAAGDVDDVLCAARGALTPEAAARAAYLVDLRRDGTLTNWLLDAAPAHPQWGLLLTSDLDPMALRRWARQVLAGSDPREPGVAVAWGVLVAPPIAPAPAAGARSPAPSLRIALDRPSTTTPPRCYAHDEQGWHLVALPQQAPSWTSQPERLLPERLHALAATALDWRVRMQWDGQEAGQQEAAQQRTSAMPDAAVAADGAGRLASLDIVGMSGPTRRARGPAVELAYPVSAASSLPPGIAVEASPRFDRLCAGWGQAMIADRADAWLLTLPEEQRLLVWSRRQLAVPDADPSGHAGASAALETRVRIESDGRVLDPAAWRAGFEALDRRIAAAIGRLADHWRSAECLVSTDLNARPALLAAEAGVAWGYRAAPTLDVAPAMQVQGHLRGCLCRWDLSLEGVVDIRGARARVRLDLADDPALMDVEAQWDFALAESPGDAPLAAGGSAGGPDGGPRGATKDQGDALPWRTFRLPLRVSVEPEATPATALVADIAWAAPAPVAAPALVGGIGLRRSPRGNGLEWAVVAALEPVAVRIGLSDPWTGRREQVLSWLPALPLIDWSCSA